VTKLHKFNERRINRRTAYTVFCELDRESGRSPGIVAMMRCLVERFGAKGAMQRCVFPSHIPDEAKELQLLCCEYLQFEEGKPGELALAKATERVHRLMRGAK
jgi:hypothetical protein